MIARRFGGALVEEYGERLLHLLPDGTVEAEPLEHVMDVWRCPSETWAVGREGLVARKPDRGAWEPFTVGTTDVIDGGVGCGDDVGRATGRARICLRRRGVARDRVPARRYPGGAPR